VEEPAHSQRRKYVQMKQHHKKMVEAYKNCEIIFKVINLMSIDLEFCRHKMARCVIGLWMEDMGSSYGG
jgi:hypothetical protein